MRPLPIALTGLAGVVLLAFLWSLIQGTETYELSRVITAFLAPDSTREDLVIRGIRLPRALAGMMTGAALAVAGAICQAVTGNPLASPGLLGINAGAGFAAVVAVSVFGVTAPHLYLWWAFGGAGLSAFAVMLMGRASRTPLIGLILSGAVISGFLAALTTVLLIFDQATLDQIRFWTAGSLAGRSMAEVTALLPFILTGLVLALLTGRHLTTLSMGHETARALGQNEARWQLMALGLVVLLAGGAVALAGPIGFVGLIVPHVARMFTGPDYRRILPAAALGGAGLVTFADVLGRSLWGGSAFPVGVTMALIGAPFFIWLARHRIRGSA